MALLDYKMLPRQIRLYASNAWVRELMYRLNVVRVSDFSKALSKLEGREQVSLYEQKSHYWYMVLRKNPVTRSYKVEEMNALFPNTKSILESYFWRYLISSATVADWRIQYISLIDNAELMKTSSEYLSIMNYDTFDDETVEQLHSIDGLGALVANYRLNSLKNDNTQDKLETILNTFLRAFIFRYRCDFIWEILLLLLDKLFENQSLESHAAFAEMLKKGELFKIINNSHETLLTTKNSGNSSSLSATLVSLARKNEPKIIFR